MIKTLLKSVREYKKDTFLSPVYVTLESLIEVIIPLLLARLIDQGIEPGNMNAIWRIGITMLVLSLLSLLVGILASRSASIASTGFARNLRYDAFNAVQDYSFKNIDKFSTSSIVTRLTTDITNIQRAFQMSIRMAVRSPMMLILSLVMAFSINRRLSLVFLAAIPILGGGLILIATKAFPVFEKVFKTYDELNNVVEEDASGIRAVKSFVREDYEIEKFKGVSERMRALNFKAEFILAFNSPLMNFCVYGSMLLISWFGAKLIVGGTMTTGELTSLISYCMQILMSLMMLSMVFVMIIMSRASIRRVYELLVEDVDLAEPEEPVAEVRDGSIRFNDVDFGYVDGKIVLKDIDLRIESGEVVGILGGTGSGKSTLVSLIPRLYDATQGSVEVGGIDVREYDIKALRDAVAMVLQQNTLFSGTIKDNMRWGNENATDEEIAEACKVAMADKFINEFPDKYDTWIEQGGTNVSGGQKQRLCIARALLKKPKILILDDSTSAVDTKTDAQIRKGFRDVIPGTTKIIIAQRIASVMDADHIIVLDNGRINGYGTHEELIRSNQIYREVYETQVKGGAIDE